MNETNSNDRSVESVSESVTSDPKIQQPTGQPEAEPARTDELVQDETTTPVTDNNPAEVASVDTVTETKIEPELSTAEDMPSFELKTSEQELAHEPDAEVETAAGVRPSEAVPEQTPVSEAIELEEEPTPVSNKKWYIVKVATNREESVKAAIERKVKIEGLEEFFGQVHIPVERVLEVKKVKETKNGSTVTKEKRVTKERKKYPGYIMAELEFNDQMLLMFRETSGVGEFVGSSPGKPPTPMNDIDVQRMLGDAVTTAGESSKHKPGKTVVKLDYEKGDKVRIRDGAFAGMEGEVKEISTPKDASETPKITVIVSIFSRPVEMEFDHWQVDKN